MLRKWNRLALIVFSVFLLSCAEDEGENLPVEEDKDGDGEVGEKKTFLKTFVNAEAQIHTFSYDDEGNINKIRWEEGDELQAYDLEYDDCLLYTSDAADD